MSLLSKEFDRIALITIYEVSKILGASLHLEKTLSQTLAVIAAHLHMQRGMINLTEHSGLLRTFAAIGLTVEETRRGEFRIGEGITGKVFQYGIPIVIPDIADEPLFLNKTGASRHEQTHKIAFLGVPIKVNSECIGVLSFQFERVSAFNGFQPILQLLTMVATLIGQTVQLSQKMSAEQQLLLQEKSYLQKELSKNTALIT